MLEVVDAIDFNHQHNYDIEMSIQNAKTATTIPFSKRGRSIETF
jgi:hypothetical protein